MGFWGRGWLVASDAVADGRSPVIGGGPMAGPEKSVHRARRAIQRNSMTVSIQGGLGIERQCPCRFQLSPMPHERKPRSFKRILVARSTPPELRLLPGVSAVKWLVCGEGNRKKGSTARRGGACGGVGSLRGEGRRGRRVEGETRRGDGEGQPNSAVYVRGAGTGVGPPLGLPRRNRLRDGGNLRLHGEGELDVGVGRLDAGLPHSAGSPPPRSGRPRPLLFQPRLRSRCGLVRLVGRTKARAVPDAGTKTRDRSQVPAGARLGEWGLPDPLLGIPALPGKSYKRRRFRE